MSDTAFHDLPAHLFPFVVELVKPDGQVVWTSGEVPGPGALRIPGRKEHGVYEILTCRVTFADGQTTESTPE